MSTIKAPDNSLSTFIGLWADDAFVVGQQLVIESRTYLPDLEDTLAVGSFAQNHLGHVRALYGQLGLPAREIQRLLYARSVEQFQSCALADAWDADDWAFMVLKGYLYNTANRVREQAFARAEPAWGSVVGMLGQETAQQIQYWSNTVRLLWQIAEGRQRLGRALESLWPCVADFFFLPGVKESEDLEEAALLASWWSTVQPFLGEVGLVPPTDVAELTAELKRIRSGAKASGRQGQHAQGCIALISESQSVYRRNPDWTWG